MFLAYSLSLWYMRVGLSIILLAAMGRVSGLTIQPLGVLQCQARCQALGGCLHVRYDLDTLCCTLVREGDTTNADDSDYVETATQKMCPRNTSHVQTRGGKDRCVESAPTVLPSNKTKTHMSTTKEHHLRSLLDSMLKTSSLVFRGPSGIYTMNLAGTGERRLIPLSPGIKVRNLIYCKTMDALFYLESSQHFGDTIKMFIKGQEITTYALDKEAEHFFVVDCIHQFIIHCSTYTHHSTLYRLDVRPKFKQWNRSEMGQFWGIGGKTVNLACDEELFIVYYFYVSSSNTVGFTVNYKTEQFTRTSFNASGMNIEDMIFTRRPGMLFWCGVSYGFATDKEASVLHQKAFHLGEVCPMSFTYANFVFHFPDKSNILQVWSSEGYNITYLTFGFKLKHVTMMFKG